MLINHACSAIEALSALDKAIYSQITKFDPKTHNNIMAAILKDKDGQFNPDAKKYYPTIHKGWKISTTKRQLVLVFKYLRLKCFDAELKLVYNKINLPFYWKWIINLRSLR